MSDIVKRLRGERVHLLADIDIRLEAADRIEALEAALEKAEKALQPFARHVDKRTCKITMLWQDGDYKSTYTDTLTPQDFFAAHEAICAARDAVNSKKGKRNE